MYINRNNKIVYTEYEKKNDIVVSKATINFLKENKLPLFYNNIHFIQKYYKEYANQQLINKCIKDIYDISNNQNKYYHQVIIPKRNGKERVLTVPNNDLKKLQKYILNRLLVWYEPLDCVKGYTKGRGIKENAKMHLNSNYILKLDISDFFGSIHFGKVVNNILPSVYDKNLRVLIANLCMVNGSLPQGAPTSPIISNMVMHKFDEIMDNYCKKNKLIYTRYADDMFISSENDFAYKKVLHKIEYLLNKYYAMELNKEKIHYLHDGLKEEICGIIVNEKMQVSKKYRDCIRQEMYYLDKYGVEKHIYALYYDKKIDKVLTPLAYYQKLLGKINYVLNINSNDTKFIEYRNKINRYINELKPKKETKISYPREFREYFSKARELHYDYENAPIEEKVLYNFMNRLNDETLDEEEVYSKGNFLYERYNNCDTPGRIEELISLVEDKYEFYYEKAYKENDLWATYMLMLYFVNENNEDPMLVHYWCERLATLGFYRGLLIEGANSSNVTLIKKAADNKDPKAQLMYAKDYCKPYSTEYIKYILASAENNYTFAYFYAADIYLHYELFDEAYLFAIKGALVEDEDCLKITKRLADEKGYKLPNEVLNILEDYDLDDDLDEDFDEDDEDEDDEF